MKNTVKRIAATALAAMMALTSTAGAMAAEYYSNSLSVGNRLVRKTETPAPTAEPTPEAVIEATAEPTAAPTAVPTAKPTAAPKATKAPVAETTDEVEAIEYDVLANVPVNGDADIRLVANGLSEIIETVADQTVVAVLGIEGDWVHVLSGDVIGYVYIDSIMAIFDVEGLMPEPTPTPEVAPGATPAPNFKVTIFSSRRSVMAPGEPVYLTSKIEGFEGYEIKYQWQCDKGEGFENIENANEATYVFEASVETLSYDWRLAVYYR